MDMADRYDPKLSEQKWQTYWIENKIYSFDPDSKKEIFSIDTPPPTVSGKMHLGHAFSYSQQDFIARYKRMRGYNVFYPFGTDDNGLATERLIEKMKNVKGTHMPRDEFTKLCLETLDKELRPTYIKDWKNIGMSCDWNIFYTTINEHCQRISQRMFLDLVKKGRAYRKFSPVIFCPQCRTSIAQVEMEDKEKETTLNYIKGRMDSGEYIIYATTRPELHPSCVGISLDEAGEYATVQRPDGERWIISRDAFEKMKDEFSLTFLKAYPGKNLVGKKVFVPFAEPVFVSHDISAQTQYGTGVVYYCTYGGLDCVFWMARHPEAKPIHIMDETGTYNEKSPYKGMNSDEARKQILADLEEKGLLIKKDPMRHTTNVHERCGTPIEYIALNQWFIKYLDLKDEFLARGNELKWYPDHMRNRFENWVKGLQWDWCISRQRFSGVPFPVWYEKKTGKPIFAEEKDLPIDPLKRIPKGHTKEDTVPESDIMDTWATSSLTPQITAELFRTHPVFPKLFPMSLRPQAHDIITFWLFNTVVRSHLHNHCLPWKETMISGWALDPHGKKMSKSKGNVVEPQIMIGKYSADALRFWAAGSKLGDDLPFQEKDLLTGQKFATKLWNASKFAFMHLMDYNHEKHDLELVDRYILSKLSRIIEASTENFERYDYSKTKLDVESFFWHDFCDNYLEIVKDRLYNPDKRGEEAKRSAQFTLFETLLSLLKLMAPIMPFLTEEIYQAYYADLERKKSIHNSEWPAFSLIDEEAERIGQFVIDAVEHARRAKSERKVSLKTPIKQMFLRGKLTVEEFGLVYEEIKAATFAEEIEYEALPANSEMGFGCELEI